MFERRLRIVFSLALLWFAVLGIRLFSMQVVAGDEWRQRSQELSQSRIRLAARRGEILDRHGAVLAADRLERDLMIRLDHFDGSAWICRFCGRPAVSTDDESPSRCRECRRPDFEPGPERDLAGLPDLLGRTAVEFGDALESVRRDWRRHVKREIGRIEIKGGRVRESRIEEQYASWQWILAKNVPADVVKEISCDPARYRGLTIRSIWRRARVGGASVHDIVGRVSGIQSDEVAELRERGYSLTEIYRMEVGRSGIENSLEERLAARAGWRLVDRDPRGGVREVVKEVPAKDGETIRTSIDLALQKHLAAYLAVEGKRHRARGAFFTALDPATGEVLVHVGWARPENGVNLAFTPTVPGSVFKVVTALAGMETAELDPTEIFDCVGRWHRIRCHDNHVHGRIGLEEALAGSCNGYFGHAADVLGIDLLSWWARHLGFGAGTGLEMTNESAGLIPDPEWKARRFPEDPTWHRGETWQVGFGQGPVLVTPVQVARLMALVANGGVLRKATFLAGGSGPGRKIIEAHSLSVVRRGLEAVVDRGTASRTELPSFRAAGKTGTGDLPGGMRNVAWFAGYAPREAPRVAFACCFVDVKGYGGGVAGPVCVEFLREFTRP